MERQMGQNFKLAQNPIKHWNLIKHTISLQIHQISTEKQENLKYLYNLRKTCSSFGDCLLKFLSICLMRFCVLLDEIFHQTHLFREISFPILGKTRLEKRKPVWIKLADGTINVVFKSVFFNYRIFPSFL